jgi:carboxylate-amine ligase
VENLQFKKNKIAYTLGVELELQIVDNQNFNLTPLSQKIIDHMGNPEWLHPELFQSMIEIVSSIHTSVDNLTDEMKTRLKALHQAGEELDLKFISTGTHPTAYYKDRIIYPGARYQDLIDRNQIMAKRLMIFGVHVHIGCYDSDHYIKLHQFMLNYHPLFIALSASSPFWQELDSGLNSFRSTIFESLPTGGHSYQFESWEKFELMTQSLLKSGSISSLKDLWWDSRPSLGYGTLELRMFDGINTQWELKGILHIIKCLCNIFEKLDEVHKTLPDWIIRENKWRAARYGLMAPIIISESGEQQLLQDKILNDLSVLTDNADKEHAINYLNTLFVRGNSAQRQRKQFEKRPDFNKLLQFLVQEHHALL